MTYEIISKNEIKNKNKSENKSPMFQGVSNVIIDSICFPWFDSSRSGYRLDVCVIAMWSIFP